MYVASPAPNVLPPHRELQDLIAYIQPGVAQNMGENALALLHYLASSESPITTLPEHPPRPTTVYFSHLGRFWMYSFTTAKVGQWRLGF